MHQLLLLMNCCNYKSNFNTLVPKLQEGNCTNSSIILFFFSKCITFFSLQGKNKEGPPHESPSNIIYFETYLFSTVANTLYNAVAMIHNITILIITQSSLNTCVYIQNSFSMINFSDGKANILM